MTSEDTIRELTEALQASTKQVGALSNRVAELESESDSAGSFTEDPGRRDGTLVATYFNPVFNENRKATFYSGDVREVENLARKYKVVEVKRIRYGHVTESVQFPVIKEGITNHENS